MKDKVIRLAPKVPGSSDIRHMRPISLYAVVRKIWTTIIAKQIHLEWHQNDVFHRTQYGYRLDNGTEMPLTNIINKVEKALHLNITTLVNFWDARRATPHYFKERKLHSSNEMANHAEHFFAEPSLAFAAERGIGQGESASSLMWVALYGILLEWIDPEQMHLYQAEAPTPTSMRTPRAMANAYADDLATLTCGHAAFYWQQRQTDWLSAFCAFSNLQLHPDKIAAIELGKKYPGRPEHIIVYDHSWNEIACQIVR
jgi:hypothetical protein